MKWEEQKRLFDAMVGELNGLLTNKGREYASDADALANFKSGDDIGVTPLQKAWIFTEKHISAIKSYIKKGQVLSNEPIEGRVHDAINYLFLILCLIKEQEQAKVKESGSTNTGDLVVHLGDVKPAHTGIVEILSGSGYDVIADGTGITVKSLRS